MGALDADELLAPFQDRCLPRLMANCTVDAHCGGVLLNRRLTRGSDILSGNSAHPRSALQITMHQPGTIEGDVKSIVRVRAAIQYWTPHAVLQRRPFCIMDEFMDKCRSRQGNEGKQHSLILRWPPMTVRAALYHVQCVTLLDWVMKKSLQGWPSNHEAGFFLTLPAIVQDYHKNCAPLPTINASRRNAQSPFSTAKEDKHYNPGLLEFLREMDARTLATLGTSKQPH